jgi:hypothetical protein
VAAHAKDTPPGLYEIGCLAYSRVLIAAPYSTGAEQRKGVKRLLMSGLGRSAGLSEGGELLLRHLSTSVPTLPSNMPRRSGSDDSRSTLTLHTAGATIEREDL